jgi:hypothetical protein
MPFFDMSRAVATPDVANAFFSAQKEAKANALAEEQRVKGMQEEQLTKGLAEASWVLSGIPKDQISQSMPHFVEGYEKANGAGSWANADDTTIRNFASVGRTRAAGLLGVGPEQFAPKPKTYQSVAPGNSLYALDSSGNPTLVTTAPSNGTPKSGFGNISPSDFSPRSLARYKASIDPATGQGDYSLLERVYSPQPGVNLMTPSQVAAAGLPTGTVAQVDERGKVNVVNKPEGGGAPNGEERSAAAFGNRMVEAEKALSGDFSDYVPSTLTSILAQSARSGGAITSSVGNSSLSPRDRSYSQYAQDWIRAKLRKESGAVIGPQEMEDEYRMYFPMPGDDPKTLNQKRQSRLVAQQGMLQMAGRAAPSQGSAPAGTPANGQRGSSPETAVPVRSLQEARRLKPGTWFVNPAGEKLQSNGAEYDGR